MRFLQQIRVRPPTATLNDVVNRDGREILMVDVPVFHCVRLGELTS